jgi:YHS domain-containing protein
MEQLTFKDQQVAQYVDSAYVPLIIDADKHSDLVSAFHITAYPTTLVVSPELKITKRFTGFQSASSLLPELERLVQKQFASMDEIVAVSATSPVNTTPFAFEGFCLVSILEDTKLRRGTPEFVTTYKDQQICFHSEAHLKKFQENPLKYWPVANGKCLVSEREEQQESIGDPRVGVTWRGRLWLFSDREHQQRFIRSPRKYMSGKI